LINNGFDFNNIKETALKLALSTYATSDITSDEYWEDEAKGIRATKPVMEIYYVDGDIYAHINTFIINLQYVHIPAANELIAGLLNAAAPTGQVGPQNDQGNPVEVDMVKYYINLALADYGLTVNVTKALLLGVFTILSVDLEAYLTSLDLGVEVGVNLSPLEIYLALQLRDVGMDCVDQEGSEEPNDKNFITIGASIGKLAILVDHDITISDEEKAKYDKIEKLETIGAKLGGVGTFEIVAPEVKDENGEGTGNGKTNLQHIIDYLRDWLQESAHEDMLKWIREKAIYEEKYKNYTDEQLINEYRKGAGTALDFDALFNFGLVLEALGNVIDGNATFGGELFYQIDVILDITDIMNLKASIRFASTPFPDHEDKNKDQFCDKCGADLNDMLADNKHADIAWVSLMGVLNEETGEYDLNLFADLTKLFGEALKIEDVIRVSNFGGFTEYMNNFATVMTGKVETYNPVAMNSINNGLVLPRNAEGKVPHSILTGASIVLAITANPDEFGVPNGAPVSIVAPAAAIYSLVNSLLATDSKFEVAIDESKITTYNNDGKYSEQEYYYALQGLAASYLEKVVIMRADELFATETDPLGSVIFNKINSLWTLYVNNLNESYLAGDAKFSNYDA
ncbi:MAG: hypothetical protein J6R35_05060, partial [Clostridia bacterium]|nr:hypothetical protein [Clostridia bacterium]